MCMSMCTSMNMNTSMSMTTHVGISINSHANVSASANVRTGIRVRIHIHNRLMLRMISRVGICIRSGMKSPTFTGMRIRLIIIIGTLAFTSMLKMITIMITRTITNVTLSACGKLPVLS